MSREVYTYLIYQCKHALTCTETYSQTLEGKHLGAIYLRCNLSADG